LKPPTSKVLAASINLIFGALGNLMGKHEGFKFFSTRIWGEFEFSPENEGCSLPRLKEMGESSIRSMKIFIAINEKSRYCEEKLSMKIDNDGFNLCTRQLIPVFDQVFTYPCKIVKKQSTV